MAHANYSPSSSAGWLACPGYANDDTGSASSREGTAAHELAQRCLEAQVPAKHFLGATIPVEGQDFAVDADMAGFVQVYLDYVTSLVDSLGAELHIEQRVPLTHMTGEAKATGTADAVLLTDDEIIVVDLKYGRGVAVEAEGNTQLRMYASGALYEHGLARDFQRARMVIVQPRLGGISEEVITVEELAAFEQEVREAIAFNGANPEVRKVSTKGCRWCANKGTCAALREDVLRDFDTVKVETAGIDAVALALTKAPLVEAWLKALRSTVETTLLAGGSVPGWKLVQGKRGPRKWSKAEDAETALKAMRIPHDRMYDYSVVSPTTAEALFKEGVIGPRQWPKLQPLITQSEGGLSVAPESYKRPAMTVTSACASDFDDVTAQTLTTQE